MNFVKHSSHVTYRMMIIGTSLINEASVFSISCCNYTKLVEFWKLILKLLKILTWWFSTFIKFFDDCDKTVNMTTALTRAGAVFRCTKGNVQPPQSRKVSSSTDAGSRGLGFEVSLHNKRMRKLKACTVGPPKECQWDRSAPAWLERPEVSRWAASTWCQLLDTDAGMWRNDGACALVCWTWVWWHYQLYHVDTSIHWSGIWIHN